MKIDINATQNAISTVMALSVFKGENRKRMYHMMCAFDKRGMPPTVFLDAMKESGEAMKESGEE